MANEFPMVRLGDVIVNHDSRRIPVREADRKPGPYPYYGASGVVDYVDKYLFDGLHLLIAEDGENLRTRQTPVAFLADGKFWVNNHAHIVTGNDRADTRYLSYALAVTDISGYLTGSAMPKLSQKSMNAIEVPLPPLNLQLLIAKTLGSLDDKIEQNRRTGRKLEGLARAVFKAWFVDFLPVRAKMAAAENDPSLLLPQAEPNTWYVYAIECNDGSLYIGQTEDLRQRWVQHMGGRGANWTRSHPPVRVPYWERQPSREAAVEREQWLKTGFGRKWLKKQIARLPAQARTQTGEPTNAKAAGATAFPGMPPETFAALPNTLQDSPLGPVPQGWEVKPLSEAFDVNPPRRLAKGADAPYLDMKNMPTDGHAPDTWERRPHGSGMKFMNGDTLVARITPCLENGKTAYVDFLKDGEVAWGSTEYIVLRPKPPLPPIFAYCLARMEPFRDYAIQNMSGTSGRQRVAASAMEHYHIAVPDEVTARSFGEVVGPLFEYIRAGKAESAKLAALRDYLLPRLLSGRVRVRDPQPTAQRESVVLPKLTDTAKPSRTANDEFKEAVLIAALVRSLANSSFPLGRKRYNKVAYFVHRKAEHDVRQTYLKKAAGPYSPWAKYQGPERIAVSNGYVKRAKVGNFVGLLPGDKIDKIDGYLSRYDFAATIPWAVGQFRYRKNDDLELLATVDFAAIDLRDRGVSVDAGNVRDLIESEPEWVPKLERAIFSDYKIATALRELESLFPSDYGD